MRRYGEIDAAVPRFEQSSPRCTHCHRPVRPTVHTREGWKVDHYLLWTGAVEPAVYRRDEGGPAIEYLRLVSIDLVVTCADCHARPEVRASLLFPEERED